MSDITEFKPPMVGALAIYQPGVLAEAMQLGQLMADAPGMVPAHLIGKGGACTAVAIQARIWNFSPFGLAALSYLTPEGRVSYESKAISAAAYSMGAIIEPLEYEPIGDWSKIAGKTKEKMGKNDKPYIVKDWTLADEQGLGVKVTGILASGVVRSREFLLASIGTRFSTLWASDPFQQLCYYAGRAWVRLNAGHVLLGVPDNSHESERDMGAAQLVQNNPGMSKQNKLAAMLDPVRAKIQGEAPPPTLVQVLDYIGRAHTPTEMEKAAKMASEMAPGSEKEKARAAYKDRMAALKAQHTAKQNATDVQPAPPPADAPREAPTFTKADILQQLRGAESLEALDAAADLIKQLPDEQDREDCAQEYRDLRGTAGGD